jgi:hypothetical protein
VYDQPPKAKKITDSNMRAEEESSTPKCEEHGNPPKKRKIKTDSSFRAVATAAAAPVDMYKRKCKLMMPMPERPWLIRAVRTGPSNGKNF